jgi:hypothetical protein
MPAIKFCGASVVGFNSRLGWGSNSSSMDVSVVEDTLRSGDIFNPPGVGKPCYFTFGPVFKFWGMLQNWQKSDSINGLPTYSVQVKDPRELLENTKVIIGAYNGQTFGMANIINAYGYWENNLGFGGSGANTGGMPWSKVLSAINAITLLPDNTGLFGGPLQFKDTKYIVDLSLLPAVPPYYRVGGSNMAAVSLMDLIQQVCEDAAVDYFVELDPGTTFPVIRVFTVSRYAQPPLGTIAQLANTNWGGTVVRSSNGLELRNAPTSHFIVGGQEQNLYTTDSIQPFWGYDSEGNPVQNMVVYIPGMGYTNAAYVDASRIAGSFNNGARTYFLTEFEMRFALDDTPSVWDSYVVYESWITNNLKSFTIGPIGLQEMISVWNFQVPFDLRNPGINPRADALADFLRRVGAPDGGASNAQLFAQNEVKDFVKEMAQNWYGKKFWVQLPFVTRYTDPETLVVQNTHDVSDGGWVGEDQTPLGLREENALKFMTQDNRFEAMALYDATAINLERLSIDDSALQQDDNTFYTKIQVDKAIYTWPQTGIPNVLITVNTPVSTEIANIGGDLGQLGIVFGQVGNNIWQAFQGRRAFGAFNVRCAPPRLSPRIVAIPLRSNISTYGPWYLAGAPGKVLVEQMNDLTPWDYGNEEFMNLAAMARVTSAVSFMQEAESGHIELVGMPLTSLGRTLIAGGPEVTNIEIRYGKEGVTTSYQFKTFTELHLNRFIKATQDRIQRMGRLETQLQKASLLALTMSFEQAETNTQIAQSTLRRFPPWQVAWATPHPVIISSAIESSGIGIRVSSALADPQEAWGGIGAFDNDTGLFRNSALCSLSAIVRPFNNNPTGVQLLLPTVRVNPTGIAGLTVGKLNPFLPGNNDFEYLTGGNDPSSTGTNFLTRQSIDWNNVRGVGLPMPIMGIGWGYQLDGSVISPSISSAYKVGPIDMVYDQNRGCWTSHDLIFGYISSNCLPSGGSVNMTICTNGNRLTDKTVTVKNYYGSTVPASSYITAGYMPYSNVLQIIGADCGISTPPAGIISIG